MCAGFYAGVSLKEQQIMPLMLDCYKQMRGLKPAPPRRLIWRKYIYTGHADESRTEVGSTRLLLLKDPDWLHVGRGGNMAASVLSWRPRHDARSRDVMATGFWMMLPIRKHGARRGVQPWRSSDSVGKVYMADPRRNQPFFLFFFPKMKANPLKLFDS